MEADLNTKTIPENFLDLVSKISAKPTGGQQKPPDRFDDKSFLEKEAFALGRAETNIESAYAQSMASVTRLREKFATRIFWCFNIWLVAIFSIVLMEAFLKPGARLSNTVLIAILTAGSTNIIGLLYVFIKNLYDRRHDHHI